MGVPHVHRRAGEHSSDPGLSATAPSAHSITAPPRELRANLRIAARTESENGDRRAMFQQPAQSDMTPLFMVRSAPAPWRPWARPDPPG